MRKIGGVVSHPSDWEFSGHNEIQNPGQRYALIDYRRLTQLLGLQTLEELKESHNAWVEEALRSGRHVRESTWVQSVANLFMQDSLSRLLCFRNV